jgi:hypothetical protein
MKAGPRIEVVHRGRFVALPTATARLVGPNAWEIRIPTSDPAFGSLRRTPTAEAWDGVVFSIDGIESEPATGSGEGPDHVVVVALTFPTSGPAAAS